MTIYGIEREYRFGGFHFAVAYDSGNECGFDQRDIHWGETKDQYKWVRSFYFKDANERHMKAFCKQFAEDEVYRKACVAQKTDWAIRDRLFRRNAIVHFWQASLLAPLLGDVPDVYEYLKKHWQAIVNLESYQRIQQLDNAFNPSGAELDPEIRSAVESFNQVEGVKTKFSCQGVTQTILYENLPILVDSPHARLAYISFEALPTEIEPVLQTYSPTVAEYIPYSKTLQAMGDNLQFRQTAVELAQFLSKNGQ